LDLAYKFYHACDKYFLRHCDTALHNILYSDKLARQNPAKLYALAWLVGSRETARHVSHYTHALDLSNATIRQSVTAQGKLNEALIALYDLLVRREASLDLLVAKMPVWDGLCSVHQNHESLTQGMPIVKDWLRKFLSEPFGEKNISILGSSCIPLFTKLKCSCYVRLQDRSTSRLIEIQKILQDYPSEIICEQFSFGI
jgi:hypothetical protein